MNFGGLQFEAKAVARLLQLTFLYRVEMGWEVRSKGRSRWHNSRLKGWISHTGVG